MIILVNLLAMAFVIISCQLCEGAARLQWLVTPVHLWTGLVSSWTPNSFPHSPGLLVGLWGARSFTILPPPPWLACRSMRSQVLYYPSPTPWLACRFMRSQVLHYPSPTPWLACRFMRSQVLHYLSPSFPHSPGLLVGLWGAMSFTLLSHPSPTPLACL